MQTSTQVGGRTWPPAEQGAGAEVLQQSCPWLTKPKKKKKKKNLETSRLGADHDLLVVKLGNVAA